MALSGRNENFVSITSEVGKKSNRRFVCADDPPAVLLFGGDDVLKKSMSGVCEMALTDARFGLDGFENKVRGVNLTVRMRIRNADHLALVFKDQNMVDPRLAPEF